MDTVYLLHFERPIGDPAKPKGQAQHYLGWTSNLQKRLKAHGEGRSGAGIVAEFHRQGIAFELARIWEGGSRELERHLKTRRKNSRRLCPICQTAKNHTHTEER